MTKQIETALQADPYLCDEHVTVTVTNGAAHRQEVVFDDRDPRIAMRTSRRIPGVGCVVNELEISATGSD